MSQQPPDPRFPPPLGSYLTPGQTAGVGTPGPYGPHIVQRTSAAAVTSLVCGLFGCVPVLTGFLAIFTGIIGMVATRNPLIKGRGLAIAGTILGIISLLAWGGLIGVGAFGWIATQPQRMAGTQFVNDMMQGNLAAAQSDCTPNVKSDDIAAQIDLFKKGSTKVGPVVPVSDASSGSGLATEAIIRSPGGAISRLHMTLLQQSGTWKVNAFSTRTSSY